MPPLRPTHGYRAGQKLVATKKLSVSIHDEYVVPKGTILFVERVEGLDRLVLIGVIPEPGSKVLERTVRFTATAGFADGVLKRAEGK